MKFANYNLNEKSASYIGDWMQIIAIDELYRQMGIDLSEVVYINVADLSTYSGEYVILPVSMPLVAYEEKGIAGLFSEHIIPVFLGLTMVKETLSDLEVEYLRRYAPVGCRDEKTLRVLRKFGIEAFLHGCLTITMPEARKESRQGLPPYIVDVDDDFLEIIPQKIKNAAVYRSHFAKVVKEGRKEYTRNLYAEYKSQAGIVITSLLHCALPCLAAGIPVILVKNSRKISYRFSWLEKILAIHTEKDIVSPDFDWNPQPADIRDIKKRIFDFDRKILLQSFDKYEKMYDISWFYENRKKHEYINDACQVFLEWLRANWQDKNGAYRYAVWGLTQISEYLADYIAANYPNASLSHVYDRDRRMDFRGIQSESPDGIKDNMSEYVFVTSMNASMAAKKFFEEIRFPEKQYALSYARVIAKM